MPKISDTDGKSPAIGCCGREEGRREEKRSYCGGDWHLSCSKNSMVINSHGGTHCGRPGVAIK